MITYQDFLREDAQGRRLDVIRRIIAAHTSSAAYKMARDADEYDRQRNVTIYNFVRTILSATGEKIIDTVAANNRIASNFFRRLNVQRNMYSLGNGVTFAKDKTKEKLGVGFDEVLRKAGYAALIHGTAFLFWNVDRAHVFRLTEFAPVWDEIDGALCAGVRFWRLDAEHPLTAVLYTPDGYETYTEIDGELTLQEPMQRYRQTVVSAPAMGEMVIGGSNYSRLPIFPLWGSELHQSTLVGMQQSIDSFDMIRSGFANDLSDCAQIYWIIKNAGGMNEADLAHFREKLMYRHIAQVSNADENDIQPYTQEIPFEARSAYLDRIRAGIYEDFGALDVSSISAAAKTATEINAAYQPLDENADDFEYQIIDCVTAILGLLGVTGDDAIPLFKRNRIANQLEQTTMVLSAANYLDDEAVLDKLPWITSDEAAEILARKDAEDMERMQMVPAAGRTAPEDDGV